MHVLSTKVHNSELESLQNFNIMQQIFENMIALKLSTIFYRHYQKLKFFENLNTNLTKHKLLEN